MRLKGWSKLTTPELWQHWLAQFDCRETAEAPSPSGRIREWNNGKAKSLLAVIVQTGLAGHRERITSIAAKRTSKMGLDLCLLPFDGDSGNWAYSHTMLQCNRDSELFEKIQKLKSIRVPPDFGTFHCRDDEYEQPHYGNTQETPYGEPVEYVLAHDLVKITPDDTGYVNKAVWAYLKELPPRTKVALFWR